MQVKVKISEFLPLLYTKHKNRSNEGISQKNTSGKYLWNVLKILMYFMEEPFLVAILAVTSKVKRGVMKTLKETRFNNVKTVFVLRG